MRKICLALWVVALGAATPVHAQDSMLQKLFSRPVRHDKETWAAQYTPGQTTPQTATVVPASEPSFLPATPVVVPAATGLAVPAATGIAVPAATGLVVPDGAGLAAPAAPSGPAAPQAAPANLSGSVVSDPSAPTGHCAACAGGCKQGCVKNCLDKLKAWVTYRQLHGCCGECASCCHIPPLYLYTVHECVDCGQEHKLPCCAGEMGPFRGLLCGEHALHPTCNGAACKSAGCNGAACSGAVSNGEGHGTEH
jgi:hypothetical protein